MFLNLLLSAQGNLLPIYKAEPSQEAVVFKLVTLDHLEFLCCLFWFHDIKEIEVVNGL